MKMEQIDWREFLKLLEAGELGEFWEQYAAYLERSGIVSNARLVLHRAAKLSAEALKK